MGVLIAEFCLCTKKGDKMTEHEKELKLIELCVNLAVSETDYEREDEELEALLNKVGV